MSGVPNINCQHYDRGCCNKLPKKKWLFIAYTHRQECVLIDGSNTTICNLQEKYPKPSPPPPPPPYNPPRHSGQCSGRCGCACGSMPPSKPIQPPKPKPPTIEIIRDDHIK